LNSAEADGFRFSIHDHGTVARRRRRDEEHASKSDLRVTRVLDRLHSTIGPRQTIVVDNGPERAPGS
jgi:hypothetical protein